MGVGSLVAGPISNRASQFFTSAGQEWSDAVFRHTDLGADFSVGFSFEVKHTNGGSFVRRELIDGRLDLFGIFARECDRGGSGQLIAYFVDGLVIVGQSQLCDPAQDDTSGDNCQVRCERAFATKAAKDGEIFFEPR